MISCAINPDCGRLDLKLTMCPDGVLTVGVSLYNEALRIWSPPDELDDQETEEVPLPI